MKKIFLVIIPVILVLITVSCSDETAINKILGTSAQAPVFMNYKVVSGTQVDFNFNIPVKVISTSFIPAIEIASTADGESVSVHFAGDHSGGMQLTADVLVEDEDGNTLNVLVPFRTRNDRVPQFVINEVRTENTKPRSEFIELKMKSNGNLGALRLFAASVSNDEPIYEFPPVEVLSGDYVVLHLRTYPGQENCIDELKDNLALAQLSGSATEKKDMQNTARDLFVPSNKKLLHKSEVVYIVDQDDHIVDAVMFAEDEKAWQKNSALKNAAELLAKQGAWLDPSGTAVKTPLFSHAVNSAGTVTTRTLCRDESKNDTNTLNDWYICATSKGTPGLANISL
ncbi:MAG: hypothetical protein Ta2B_04520 [Termitinemataceae bacterium]|nr:MAG: hypothetical protein Ta2B_04520 [Termitinemataceae bacterium]